MKIVPVLLVLTFVFTACSEELVLYGDGDRSPVVYSLLDMNLDQQYVRVGFTYQAGNQSVLIPPQTDPGRWSDSVLIYMEEWDSLSPVRVHNFTYAPEITKTDGWFPSDFSRVYSCSFRPRAATRYQLYVYFPDLDKLITAQTVTLRIPELLDPENVPGRKITFHQETPFTLRYNSFDEQGTFQAIFRLYYTEERNGSLNYSSADYITPVFVEASPKLPAQHQVNGNDFFKTMAAKIAGDSLTTRKVVNLECIFNAAGPEIGFLLNPNKNDMGAAGSVYSFTNLSSGAGIFSSRYVKRLTDLQLSDITIDSLAMGSKTRHLNFSDHTGK